MQAMEELGYFQLSGMVYLTIKAQGGVVYGQNRVVLMHNAECLDTALSRGIGLMPQTPEVPYCFYKPVANSNAIKDILN
jgi:hypothetical protein